MMIKNWPIFFVLFLVFSFSIYGQSGQINGRIIDNADNQPLEFAQISIFNQSDSTLINGALSDASGTFLLKGLTFGNYYLVAQFLGYNTFTIDTIELTSKTPLNLGTLSLLPSQLLLDEVEISGRKTTTFHKIDRQVFDAKQFQSAQGGTAIDILRNLPSISVDALGNISVRGATGFIIMLNGKQIQTDPATLLGQLSANAINDIEIITTPSAKYDPDGKAGIINIKTKQGVLDGFYIIANAQLGLPSIEPYDNAETALRYSGDITINYKTGKWDLSVGLDYRRNDVSGRREGYVNTYLNNILTEFPSDGERSFDRENYSGRASAVFSPNSQHTVGFSFYAGKRTQYRTADILYDTQRRTFLSQDLFQGTEVYWDLFQQSGQVSKIGIPQDSITYYNENLRVRRGDFLIGAIDYTHTFNDKSNLKVSTLYEHTILGGPTDNVSLDWPNIQDTLQAQFNTNDNPLDGVRFQLDYRRELGKTNWESGYQYRYLKHPGDFLYLERNFETNEWEIDPTFTNTIELKRQIHALYTQFSGKANKLSYTAGVRLEYFDRSVKTATPDRTYTLQQFNPFPSINLQYDLGNNLFAKTGYSRRIERTTTFKMTPFPEREHSETLEQGDAELLPEFIDLVEMGLIKNWEDNSVFVTGYYRRVKDVINRVNTAYNDSILNRIYTNAGNAQALGLEVGTTIYPAKWWRLYFGTNVYNYRIQGNLFGDAISTSNTIYSINTNSSFQLAKTLELQAGLNYLSERVTAQGVDSRFYNPNLSLRKTFLDKKLALTLQWQNIDMGLLSSNEQRITTARDNFYTTTNYVYEVDIVMIGLTFQLNQPSKKVKLIKSEFGDKEF